MTSGDINVDHKWIEDYIHFDTEVVESVHGTTTMIYIRCEYCEERFGSFEPGLYRPKDYVKNAILHYKAEHPRSFSPTYVPL